MKKKKVAFTSERKKNPKTADGDTFLSMYNFFIFITGLARNDKNNDKNAATYFCKVDVATISNMAMSHVRI